mmetsp:Transcript_92016/g.159644  ORF Transcript_92016/g.159644 Transcript_92016/m.159644 type:complete len:207 (+) Transcript_92016:672-1292(+)
MDEEPEAGVQPALMGVERDTHLAQEPVEPLIGVVNGDVDPVSLAAAFGGDLRQGSQGPLVVAYHASLDLRTVEAGSLLDRPGGVDRGAVQDHREDRPGLLPHVLNVLRGKLVLHHAAVPNLRPVRVFQELHGLDRPTYAVIHEIKVVRAERCGHFTKESQKFVALQPPIPAAVCFLHLDSNPMTLLFSHALILQQNIGELFSINEL